MTTLVPASQNIYRHTCYTQEVSSTDGKTHLFDIYETTFSVLLKSAKGDRSLPFCITSTALSAGVDSGLASRPFQFAVRLLIPDESILVYIPPNLVLSKLLPRNSFSSYNERIAQSMKISVL